MPHLFSTIHLAPLLIAGLLLGDAPEQKWDFQSDAVGAEPAGFCFEESRDAPPGRWEVVDEESNHVLAQLDEHPARRRYALAMVKDSKLEDVDLTVRIKAVRGEREQSGGLVWRYQNPGSYLVARLDVAEKNVRLFRFWDGNRVQMAIKGELPLKTGEWYTLRVEHDGKHIKVYLNGDIMFMEHDKHFRDPGRIGLWTKSHSVMYFDDFAVKNLDEEDDDRDKHND